MDAQELLDWQVLEAIDPFGQARDDARFQLLSAVIANSMGAKKKDGTSFAPSDFELKFPDPFEEVAEKGQQTAAQIETLFRAMVRANNIFWEQKEKIIRH